MSLGNLLLLLAVAVSGGDAAFSLKNCSPAGSPFVINTVNVTPDPVHVPGDVHIHIVGSVSAPIQNSTIQIAIQQKHLLLNLPIPCVSGIGSCTYHDSCTLLDTMTGDGAAGSVGSQIKNALTAAGIDASACPQPARDINLNMNIHIPELTGLISVFASGDYHIKVDVTENASHKHVLCLEIEVSIKEPCSGLGCIFG